jgi:hypothetical protein
VKRCDLVEKTLYAPGTASTAVGRAFIVSSPPVHAPGKGVKLPCASVAVAGNDSDGVGRGDHLVGELVALSGGVRYQW